jgi:demethylmenaquinone methyltransferase/2-methoxy-6-polyprenyl-1,4-benzoquinol methylase
MNTEELANTRFGRIFLPFIARIMESNIRYRFFGPSRILKGAEIRQGQKVLELGCGTGFFTVHAANLLGEKGKLVALDILPESVKIVTEKVQKANLKNVSVVKGNALNTKLDTESLDTILVFGVIPAPMLPMNQLLSEMHRILKPGGIMAVWPTSWVQRNIVQSGLFTLSSKKNGVTNYKKII